jgi:four helix bundle protein
MEEWAVQQENIVALARSFRELEVYRAAREQAREIFEVSREFPREETYALTDQIRRSARAVSALVAEAWGRRRYPAAFANKMSEALAEAGETQAWLDHAVDCGYLSTEQYQVLDAAWQSIGGMLFSMMQRSESFCTNVAKR